MSATTTLTWPAAAVRLAFTAWFGARPDDPARVLGRRRTPAPRAAAPAGPDGPSG